MSKQIMVTDEIYEKLKGLKKGGKNSFTKVIEGLVKRVTPRQRLLGAISDFEMVAVETISHNSLEPTMSMLRSILLAIQKDPEQLESVNKDLDKICAKLEK